MRRFYGIIPNHWNLAVKIEKKKYEASEEAILLLENAEELPVKKELLEAGREYLQVKFRTLEPAEHFHTVGGFWKLPHGTQMLSSWFEWLTGSPLYILFLFFIAYFKTCKICSATFFFIFNYFVLSGGSRDGWLQATIEDNLEPVLTVVKEILGEKRGNLWIEKCEQIRFKAETENGNETMVWIFLLREWSNLYHDKPHRVVYVEGEDVGMEVPLLPHVHVRIINKPCEDFSQVIVSLKCQNTMIFEDIGLSAALAGLIEMYFSFNMEFDSEGDATLNFIQRILGI